MKLRSLAITNVRKFAGKTARISEIGDGVTVISAPNEFGKSTFFDAIHALFFSPHTSSAQDVKRLQPHSKGAPEITVDIETSEGRFRIEKRYLSKPFARVTDIASGRLVAQADLAESWIGQAVSGGISGPAGLLWVRQGLTQMEPEGTTGTDKSEKERLLDARRDLLSSVAGEIDMMTGGRRMDTVLKRCTDALGQLANSRGPKAGGAWKAAVDAVSDLSVQEADLREKRSDLASALEERRKAEREMLVWTDPEAATARKSALITATAAFENARAHAAKWETAKQAVELASIQRDSARTALSALQANRDRLQAASEKFTAALTNEAGAIEAEASARTSEIAAQEVLDQAEKQLGGIRTRMETAQKRAVTQAAGKRLQELESRLAQATEYRRDKDAARVAAAGIKVTEHIVATIETAQAAYDRVSALQEAQAVAMTLSYSGDARVLCDGTALAEDHAHLVTTTTEFALEGIGRMTLDTRNHGGSDLTERLRDAQKELARSLGLCGVENLRVARQKFALWQEHDAKARLSDKLLSAIAPEGFDALFALVERVRTEAGERQVNDDDTDTDIELLMKELRQAEDAERLARANHARARAVQTQCSQNLALTQASLNTAKTEHSAAQDLSGDPADSDKQQEKLSSELANAENGLRLAKENAENMQSGAPDLETAEAAFMRAQSAQDQALKAANELSRRIAGLDATIRARADDGVEEAHEEVLGKLQAAKDREARFSAEVTALRRLQAALEDARSNAREAYFEPVKQELLPLLSILHKDATLLLDDKKLLPAALIRGDESEPLDILSGGTREQIAVLTRLAFARLFSRDGRTVPMILDDALVHSDDDRIEAMFTAMHRVAKDQQILVFTCRQRAFAALGGHRPEITIAQT